MAGFEREHDNLRAALTWLLEAAGQGEGGREGESSRPSAPCGWVSPCIISGTALGVGVGEDCLEQGLTVGEGVAASVRAWALCAAATLISDPGDADRTQALTEEGAGALPGAGKHRWHGARAQDAGICPLGEESLCRGPFLSRKEANALFQEVGDTWNRGLCLTQLARVATAQGEYDRARALLEEGRQLYSALGDQYRVGWILSLLARMLFLSGSDLTEVRRNPG